MKIIELLTNLYLLYSIIWGLLGLWLVERIGIKDNTGRVFAVIFSPLVLGWVLFIKIFNIKE